MAGFSSAPSQGSWRFLWRRPRRLEGRRSGELPCLAHPEGSHLGFRKPWPGGRRQVSVSVRAQQPRTWTSQPTGPRLLHVTNTPRNQNPPPHQLCLLTMKRTRKSFSADLNRLCSPALRAPTGGWGGSAHLRHGAVFCVVESVICDEQRSVTPPPQRAVSNYTHCSSIFVRTLIKTSPHRNPVKTQNVLTLIVKCVSWRPLEANADPNTCTEQQKGTQEVLQLCFLSDNHLQQAWWFWPTLHFQHASSQRVYRPQCCGVLAANALSHF